MPALVSPAPDEIKSARLAAGLTQTEAGALIGAALRTWQHWELGDRKMPPASWALFKIKLKELQR